MRCRRWPLLCLTLLLATLWPRAEAQPRAWSLDPVHTRIVFAIDHAGFSKALGTFSGIQGTLAFDPDDWTSARLEVRIPLSSLELGDAKWNRAALAANLLDAGSHPEARFTSTRVEPVDERRATVHGLLTLRGETREVALDVVVNAVKRYPLPPFRRTAGFSATTTLRRSDFGIDAWASLIGDNVQLRIEAEASQARAPADAAAATPDPPPLPAAEAESSP